MIKKRKSVFLSIKEKYCLEEDIKWDAAGKHSFDLVKAQEAILKIADLIEAGGGKLKYIRFLFKVVGQVTDKKDLGTFLIKKLDPQLKVNNIARCSILNIRLSDLDSIEKYHKDRQNKIKKIQERMSKQGKTGTEFGEEENKALRRFDMNYPIETVKGTRACALPLESGDCIYISFEALIALKTFYNEVNASGDKAAKIQLGLLKPPSNIENHGSYNIVKRVIRTSSPLSEENLKKLHGIKSSLSVKK